MVVNGEATGCGKHAAGPHCPLSMLKNEDSVGCCLLAQQIGVEQRAMEGHETRIAADRQVQRGDVAVADEWLGVVAQQLEIDAIEQTRRTVAAAQANDRIDFGVGERGMQVIESHIVAAGQVAVLLVDPGKNPQRITASAHPGMAFSVSSAAGPAGAITPISPSIGKAGTACEEKSVGSVERSSMNLPA